MCSSTVHQPSLTTQRLTLRPFSLDDALRMSQLAGNIRVAETTLNVPHPYQPDMARSWISTHEAGWTERKNIVYAITLTETGELLGTIGLHDIKPDQAELGYWIGEPYWGRGFCTEAAKAVIAFSFEILELSKVVAEHLKSNPASGAVMKNASMCYVTSDIGVDRYGEPAEIDFYEIVST